MLRLLIISVPRCACCRCRLHVALRRRLPLTAVAILVVRLCLVAIVRREGLRPRVEVVVHRDNGRLAVDVLRRCAVVTTDSGLEWVSAGFCDCSVVGNIPFDFDRHDEQTDLA